MNTYDPMDRITYRHVEAQPGLVTTPPVAVHRLPVGYANGSPRTYLGRTRRPAQAA